MSIPTSAVRRPHPWSVPIGPPALDALFGLPIDYPKS